MNLGLSGLTHQRGQQGGGPGGGVGSTAKSESTTPNFPRGPREFVASTQEITASSCISTLQSPRQLYVRTSSLQVSQPKAGLSGLNKFMQKETGQRAPALRLACLYNWTGVVMNWNRPLI